MLRPQHINFALGHPYTHNAAGTAYFQRSRVCTMPGLNSKLIYSASLRAVKFALGGGGVGGGGA
jgi:hypothetical protein